jgi:arginyl-tRNA synthetase
MPKKSENFSRAESKVRQEIFELIKHYLGKGCSTKVVVIDYPPNNKMGDYTVPCFLLAKKYKKAPAEIASQLAVSITKSDLIDRVVSAGPYLNFFVNQKNFSQLVLTEVAKAKANYGKGKIGKGKRVMVEYFSPNTNKPLTIGHVRNICLGSSIVALMNFCGYKVIRSTLYNDRGIAIAKTIVGYLKWGNNETPKQAGLKPDHFVGSFYTQFCQQAKANPNLETEAKRVLQIWEEGQKEIL